MWTYKILVRELAQRLLYLLQNLILELKFLPQVGIVWALDSLHTALMSHTAYYYTVSNFGNFNALAEKPVFSFNLEIGIVPILAFIVQSYFAHRAFSIDNRQWPLAVAIEFFAVAQFVLGIGEFWSRTALPSVHS